MMKHKLFLLCLLIILLVGGCSEEPDQQSVITPVNSSNAEAVSNDEPGNLEKKIEEQKQLIQTLEAANKEYLNLLEAAVSHLDEDSLREFAKMQFCYTLTVNETAVPGNGIVEVDKLPVAVTLLSEMGTNILLPQKIYEQGMLSSDDPLDHLNFMGVEPEDVEVRDGTGIQSFTYIFGEKNSLEEMEFRISDELKKRLNMDTSVIKVMIR